MVLLGPAVGPASAAGGTAAGTRPAADAGAGSGGAWGTAKDALRASRFNRPRAVASDGTHVWVANRTGNSVTELNAATSAVVKVIAGSSYGVQRAGCHLLRRHPRVGLLWVCGHRAEDRDRRPGKTDHRSPPVM